MKPVFHFVTCTNDAVRMLECRYYIQRLFVPDGWSVEITEIPDAVSMASGYNRAIGMKPGDSARTEDVPVRIYLHQDVYILNRFFLKNLRLLFEEYPDVGAVGMVGTPVLHESGVMWLGSYIGNVYEPDDRPYKEEQVFDKPVIVPADAIDGFLIATRADIPWREDLFDGFDFYDLSQSFEFRRNGYRTAVVMQSSPWCVHDDAHVLSLYHYNRYRKRFLSQYGQEMRCAHQTI